MNVVDLNSTHDRLMRGTVSIQTCYHRDALLQEDEKNELGTELPLTLFACIVEPMRVGREGAPALRACFGVWMWSRSARNAHSRSNACGRRLFRHGHSPKKFQCICA